MKIERTVVIAMLSVIVGLGVIGVSPAFARESSSLPACSPSGEFHNCFGTITFASGIEYVGEYKDGKRHGEGILTTTDSKEIMGDWKFNKPWNAVYFDGGEFRFSYKNGVIQAGFIKSASVDSGTIAAQGLEGVLGGICGDGIGKH